jgi:hypothetical protein
MIKAIAVSAAIAISIYGGYQIIEMYKENKSKQEAVQKREKNKFISDHYEQYRVYSEQDSYYNEDIYGYGDKAGMQ